MNRFPARLPQLLNLLAIAVVLAGCGGHDPVAPLAERAARPLGITSSAVPTLFDDDGNVNPASPSAVPADAGARTRKARYATPAQAAQLEKALGASVIVVEVEPGPDPAAAVELATNVAFGLQAAHDLGAEAPVLVHASDLRLGAAAVHRLEDGGFARVLLVTH